MIRRASRGRGHGPRGDLRGETTDIDYPTTARLIGDSGLSVSASEAHGILVGLICGGDPDPRSTWLELLQLPPAAAQGDVLARERQQGLDALANETLDQIHGAGVGLSLLLPDEEQPLLERATALYDWVRGFLFSLGVLGISERDLSEQTREIFRDFTDLTRLDLEALDEGEGNEEALNEIIEFVWVAAMLVFEERVASPRERPREPAR
jgi:uncharacterized protein YgfB (UPF0149 family)